MIVLHASLFQDRLALWAEMASEDRQVTNPDPLFYPYNPGFKALVEALKPVAGLKLAHQRCRVCLAWLPTRGGEVIPSSPMIADPPSSRAKPGLQPWRVRACPLKEDETLLVLAACYGRRILAPGVVIGSDLRLWAGLLRWLGSLMARQQILPALVRDESSDVWRSRWEPFFSFADKARLEQMARDLPASARCLSVIGTSTPPTESALGMLRHFSLSMVDHLMRSLAPASRKRGGRRKPFDSVHDAWLSSLWSSDSRIRAADDEIAQLASQAQNWRRAAALTHSAPFRLCFRLEEPSQDDAQDRWMVRFLLQPHADPSLLLPVSDVWKKRSAKVLKTLGQHARAYTLSALGQAASLCPWIAEGLRTSRPDSYGLSTTEAYRFLSFTAGVLEQAGFGILLPAWWSRRGARVRLKARAKVKSPRMQGGGSVELGSLFDFEWQIALGDHRLTGKELQALARLKEPLVQVRGQWMEVDGEEIKSALALWKKRRTGQANIRQLMTMALGSGEAPGGLEVESVEATGWIGSLLRQLEDPTKLRKLKSPKGFVGTLRPYQERGFSWLSFLRDWGLGACLADDMGLGKTVQTLALIQRAWEEKNRAFRPFLLVCPTSVIDNWLKEASRFTPELSVVVHHGPRREKEGAFAKLAKRQAIVITSYALLHRDLKSFQKVDWSGVVLDEAQNIKNPETRQARAARSLASEYRIALTGTPVENHIGELWSIMEFLTPGFLGKQSEFKKKFFIPIQTQRDEEAAKDLKRLTRPFILRRLKTDRSILDDLPEKQEMKVHCSLTREQASLYQAVLRDLQKVLKDAEGIGRRGAVLAALSKLKQVCNHPAQFLADNSMVSGYGGKSRSGKLARLTEMLDEVLEGHELALIFTQFAQMGKILQRHLQANFGQEVLFLHGGVAKKKRDQMVDRFQNEEHAPPILILSLKAGGTGLNLTRANHVFHYDRWWNPAVENQATDRAFRIGQTKRVQVHKFICAGTLEERIDLIIESKKEVAEQVVGSGEGWLTELSNEELRDILALRKGMIRT